MTPAPTLAVPVSAAELRALAAVHDDYAEQASMCELYSLTAESWDRATRLRRLAADLGPPVGEFDSLLSLAVSL